MADCARCGRKMPAFTLGQQSNLCPDCRQAQQAELQPGSRTSQLARALRSPVTIGLIGINAAVFLAMVLSGASPTWPTSQQLLSWGADYGPSTFGGESWRLLTSAFVHIGILHILVNMWALWNLGRMAEQVIDRGTYIASYLLCGIGSSVVATWYRPDAVSAGASGALFGLVGLLITTFWLGELPISKEITRAMTTRLIRVAVINLLLGSAVGHISNSAHVGGLVTGLVLGALLAPRPVGDGAEVDGQRWAKLGGMAVLIAILFHFAKVNFQSRM